jgi:protease-4
LVVALVASVLFNLIQLAAFRDYATGSKAPYERFHSGELSASAKIARIQFSGVIMPPYTERWLKTIDEIAKDDHVKGVLLSVDSPGGLVADSHQIYAKLKKLREKKPMVVSMKRLAASGGYYISMGGGPEAKIFAEPTTWTGSLGVIMPRYDVSELAKTWGVKSEPLVTGPMKNSLDPLQPLSEDEKGVWAAILDDAFQRFIDVIDDGRPGLDQEKIRSLATGQVYTAKQALENGLIDVIGDEDDAIAALKDQLGLKSVRVVEYDFPSSLVDVLLGASGPKQPPAAKIDPFASLWEANSSQPMYLFGWRPGLNVAPF